MKMIHLTCPGHEEATLEGYILDCEITLGQEQQRPAILVLPGGGYVYCSPREAEPVALRYASSGFHAFILRYSTGRNAANFSPLEEASWAIGLLRQHAQEWNIDPNKIAVCGFSAGGHLALSSGLMAANKPNAMILGYPAVMIPNIPGPDYLLKLLLGKEQITDEDAASLDLLSRIDTSAPPVFMAATAEDMLTGYGALPVAKRYSDLGMQYELHIFQHGPHGYALADETTADGSSQVINPAFAQWHGLSVQWLHKIFGQPTFVDQSTSRMGAYLKDLGITMPGADGGNA